MCWVMPPASPATTSASRTASSSDVLPWSTWPMIVTTGGRSTRSSSASVELGLLVDVVGRVDDLDLLVELVGEDLDRVVGQRLGERGHLAQLHQLLDDLGDRHAEVLRDVLDRRAGVDADRVGLQRASCPAGPARRRRHGAGGRRGAAGGAGGRAGRRRGHPGGARPASRSRRGARRRRRSRGRARPAARSASGAGRGLSPSPLAASAPAPLVLCAAAAFWASSSWSCGRPVSARSAASSSTAEAAALTSIPASASRFSTSAEGMSYCLASSWTRFLAMCG